MLERVKARFSDPNNGSWLIVIDGVDNFHTLKGTSNTNSTKDNSVLRNSTPYVNSGDISLHRFTAKYC